MSFWDDPQVLTAPLSLLCPLQKPDHCTVSDPSEVLWGSQRMFKLSTVQSDQLSPLLAGNAFEHFSHLGEFPQHGPQIPIEDARNLPSQPPMQLECRHGTCAPPIRLTLLKLRLGADGSREKICHTESIQCCQGQRLPEAARADVPAATSLPGPGKDFQGLGPGCGTHHPLEQPPGLGQALCDHHAFSWPFPHFCLN